VEARQAGAGTSPARSQTAEWQLRVPLRARDSGQAEPQPDGHPASSQQQGRSVARPGNPAGGSASGSESGKYMTERRCGTARGQQQREPQPKGSSQKKEGQPLHEVSSQQLVSAKGLTLDAASNASKPNQLNSLKEVVLRTLTNTRYSSACKTNEAALYNIRVI